MEVGWSFGVDFLVGHGVMLLCNECYEVTNALWANALRMSSTRVFGYAEMFMTQELFVSINGIVSPTLSS